MSFIQVMLGSTLFFLIIFLAGLKVQHEERIRRKERLNKIHEEFVSTMTRISQDALKDVPESEREKRLANLQQFIEYLRSEGIKRSRK